MSREIVWVRCQTCRWSYRAVSTSPGARDEQCNDCRGLKEIRGWETVELGWREKAPEKAPATNTGPRGRYRRTAQCGTPSGYAAHIRHAEPMCESCRLAKREYNRTAQASWRQRRTEDGAS